jgi:riboflavin kinase/FMN adenylyltransferase
MQIIRHYEDCPESAKGCVIALGNFDGIHKGHQEIIKQAINISKESNSNSAIMTFEPHPKSFFQNSDTKIRLTPFYDKGKLLENFGIDILFAMHFDKKFSQITADNFVDDILVDTLKVKTIIIGHDFIFGYKRQGNAELLKEKADLLGFNLIQIDAISKGGNIYSSTKIREFLKDGEVEKANNWLGRPHFITGKIEAGEQRGRTLGYPTANIYLKDQLRIRFGVYQVTIQIEGSNEQLPAIANIGCKPMFDDNRDILEVFIFDFDRDIYDKKVKVEFLKFIRDEEKFDSIDELTTQITLDCSKVKSLFFN